MISTRKLIALFCLTAVLLAALAPSSSGLVLAVLVPILLFIGLVTLFTSDPRSEHVDQPTAKFIALIASRAPPISATPLLTDL